MNKLIFITIVFVLSADFSIAQEKGNELNKTTIEVDLRHGGPAAINKNIGVDSLVISNLRTYSILAEIFVTTNRRYPNRFEEIIELSSAKIDNFCDKEAYRYRFTCFFSSEGYVFSAEPVSPGRLDNAVYTITNGGILIEEGPDKIIAKLKTAETNLTDDEIENLKERIKEKFQRTLEKEIIFDDAVFRIALPIKSMNEGSEIVIMLNKSALFHNVRVKDLKYKPTLMNVIGGSLNTKYAEPQELEKRLKDLDDILVKIKDFVQ